MYRSDYDAALARIYALEDDLEQTRAERNRLVRELHEKHPRPGNAKARKIFGAVLGAAVFAVAMYARIHHSQTAAAEPATHMDAYGAIDNPVAQTCELP